jgi:hypothetical protein
MQLLNKLVLVPSFLFSKLAGYVFALKLQHLEVSGCAKCLEGNRADEAYITACLNTRKHDGVDGCEEIDDAYPIVLHQDSTDVVDKRQHARDEALRYS